MPKPDPQQPVRLNKRLAQLGLCSRREADRWISAGQVTVDGEVITELGTRVHPDQQVRLSASAAQGQRDKLTILLHKPVDWVSGQPEDGHRAAVELLTPERVADGAILPWGSGPWPRRWRQGLAPAGRLDLDSSGLLVLTQDGVVARRLVGGQGEVEKEYVVGVDGLVDDRALNLLRQGLTLDGRRLRKAIVDVRPDGRLRFVLREGRKRQIRRMCVLVGLEVNSLLRVRIGAVELGDLPQGRWRLLQPGERF